MEACRGQQWRQYNLHDGCSKSEIVNIKCLRVVIKLTIKRGKREVRSHPALIELAEMLVPSCYENKSMSWHDDNRERAWAMMKAKAMNQTPKRVALDGLSSKKRPRRSIGDQIASPYIASDDELTIMPIKLTIGNERGTEKIWGHNAALGVVAREAKSGAFLSLQVKNQMQRRRNGHSRNKSSHVANAWHETDEHGPAQLRAMECRRTGHNWADTFSLDDTPYEESESSYGSDNSFQSEQVATEVAQWMLIKWGIEFPHIWCIGNQMAGREMSQNKKKHMKSRVVVPDDAGIWFATALLTTMKCWRHVVSRLTDVINTGPHRAKHNFDAVSTNTSLNAVPHAVDEELVARRVTFNQRPHTMPLLLGWMYTIDFHKDQSSFARRQGRSHGR